MASFSHFDVLIALTTRAPGALLITFHPRAFDWIQGYRSFQIEAWQVSGLPLVIVPAPSLQAVLSAGTAGREEEQPAPAGRLFRSNLRKRILNEL